MPKGTRSAFTIFMEKLSMAELQRLSVLDFKMAEKMPVVLVLDNLRSALNVGSIFRTADAFALKGLVLCGFTAQPPNREMLKTALGSTASVEWYHVADTVEAIVQLRQQGYKVWALEQTTEKIWLQHFQWHSGELHAFVLGNEVEGVADAVLNQCDGAVEIPQYGTKHSLNVAVAAGIVCWEIARLRPVV